MRRSSSSLLCCLLTFGCSDDDRSGGYPEAAADTEDLMEEAEDEASSGGESGADVTPQSDPTEPGPLSERDCPENSVLTADNFGMPFMLTWCAGCHSSLLPAGERALAPVGIDFDTLEGVRAHLDRAYIRTAQAGASMPPASGPTLEDRQQLADWLACGAPE